MKKELEEQLLDQISSDLENAPEGEKKEYKADDLISQADRIKANTPTPEQAEIIKKKKKRNKILKAVLIPVIVVVVLVIVVVKLLDQFKAKPEELSLNQTSITLNIGDTFQLKLNKTNEKVKYDSVTYLTLDDKVASVTEEGLVTALSEGKTEIQATIQGNDSMKGKTLSCQVSVDNTAAKVIRTIYAPDTNERTYMNFYSDNTCTFFTDFYTPEGAFAALGNLTIWMGDYTYVKEDGSKVTEFERDSWSIDENGMLKLENKAKAHMKALFGDDGTADENGLWNCAVESTVTVENGAVVIKTIVNNGSQLLYPGTFTLTSEDCTALGIKIS